MVGVAGAINTDLRVRSTDISLIFVQLRMWQYSDTGKILK